MRVESKSHRHRELTKIVNWRYIYFRYVVLLMSSPHRNCIYVTFPGVKLDHSFKSHTS